MLVNPSLMLALFCILGWTAYQTRPIPRHGLRGELWTCLFALLAVFAPWPIRNARVLHAFIPLRSNFGYELWQGNHPGATGVFDGTLEPHHNKQQYADYAANGEVAYTGSKAMLAKAYIRTHPGAFVRLSAERVARFWTGAGSTTNSGWVELHAVPRRYWAWRAWQRCSKGAASTIARGPCFSCCQFLFFRCRTTSRIPTFASGCCWTHC